MGAVTGECHDRVEAYKGCRISRYRRFATAGTESRSASRMIATTCPSVNLDCRITPFENGKCSDPTKLDGFWVEFSAVRFCMAGRERKTMKASKFSEAQKAFILKQGSDGVPVADICRKAGISPATYFNWKKRYEGMQPPEMRRLKQLEDENAKLKKIVADLSLDREMLQDVIRRKL
jgi:putative transposase